MTTFLLVVAPAAVWAVLVGIAAALMLAWRALRHRTRPVPVPGLPRDGEGLMSSGDEDEWERIEHYYEVDAPDPHDPFRNLGAAFWGRGWRL